MESLANGKKLVTEVSDLFLANWFSVIYMETIQASAHSLMTPATFQNREEMFQSRISNKKVSLYVF